MKAAAEADPDKQVALWFMDEARVGQKGRTTHRWWVRGERPPGLADRRFESAYIFAAVRPATGDDFALVLPRVSAKAMSTFLAEFARTVPDDMHVVMVLDGAGWHDARALKVPECMTLVPLPPYSPELNPVERVWLYVISLLRWEEHEDPGLETAANSSSRPCRQTGTTPPGADYRGQH